MCLVKTYPCRLFKKDEFSHEIEEFCFIMAIRSSSVDEINVIYFQPWKGLKKNSVYSFSSTFYSYLSCGYEVNK